MKRSSNFTVATLMAVIGLALSVPATASEPEVHPAMASFIQNASTPEDQEVIAAHFETQAAQAQSLVKGFDIHDCEHSQMMELQKTRAMFVGITARRYCRALLRRYVEQERQYRERAAYHERVAASWRASMD